MYVPWPISLSALSESRTNVKVHANVVEQNELLKQTGYPGDVPAMKFTNWFGHRHRAQVGIQSGGTKRDCYLV